MHLPHTDPELPEGVLTVRRDLCLSCPMPCAHQHALEHYGRVASVCPLPIPRWSRYGRAGRATLGLGDLVAAVAQPIARGIDAVAGTRVAECGGCKKRRESLNKVRI